MSFVAIIEEINQKALAYIRRIMYDKRTKTSQ